MKKRRTPAPGRRKRLLFLLPALMLGLVPPAWASESVEHLILAPPDLAAPAVLLSKHRRAAGLRSLVHELKDLEVTAGSYDPDRTRALIRHYWELTGKGLKYVLLMGDAPGFGRPEGAGRIPPKILPPRYLDDRWPRAKDIASDAWYGMMDDDDVPEVAVGRLPVDTGAEALALVNRIIEYETVMDHGPWRKRINVVAGQGGFGPMVDMILEAEFRKVMDREIDPAFDVKLLYANPRSPFFFPPPKFAAKALELFSEGSLVAGYVGHGSPDSFDDFRFRSVTYRIMNPGDAARLEVREGAPIIVVVACSTGHFDLADRDCITERLLAARGGPVAVLSSTRISQPYPNGVIAKRFIALASSRNPPTLGEAVNLIRTELASFEPASAGEMDKMAALIMGPANLKPCLLDHVHLYNLFGDPAMPIGAPRGVLRIEAPESARFGSSFEVKGTLDRPMMFGRILVTVEPARGASAGPLLETKKVSPEEARFEAIEANWRALNERALASASGSCVAGLFSAVVKIPEGPFTPGEYLVKVFCFDPKGCAAGSVRIRLQGEGGGEEEEDGF